MPPKRKRSAGLGRRKKPKVPDPPPKKYLGDDSPELYVDWIYNKGNEKGVRAATTIRANSRLAYKGVEIDEREREALKRQAKREGKKSRVYRYIVASGRRGTYIDANPDRGPEHLAALINEPTVTETANMRLTHETWHGKRRPIVVAVEDILPDEELLVKYGGSYRRDYPTGKVAKIPRWWKKRNQKAPFWRR